MFIKATKTHTDKAGQPVRSHRLVLAQRVGDTRLATRSIHKCWASIRESMRTWVRITTRLRQTDGTLVVNSQDTRPAAEVAQISSAAGVDPAIHRTSTRLTC